MKILLNTMKNNLQTIYQEIRNAEKQYQRLENSVSLLAVSKNHDITMIEQAILAGQRIFGESYVQEAMPKIEFLNAKYENLEWHFIGRIQSNKIKHMAKLFSWVHSVTKIEQVESLHNKRSDDLLPLNVCIEVNLNHEISKTGIDPRDVFDFAMQFKQFTKVKLRGLMAIPAPEHDSLLQRQNFLDLRKILDTCNQKNLNLDTLSMGMSDDFVEAIACGSTIVRIGTAIFGERNYSKR